jgi:hypothetical protein
MKALDNLMTALQSAGGRRRAFKMREIPLSERQRDILRDYDQHYNKGALTDIKAYDIVRGRDTIVDAIKVVWVLFGKYGMMHYFTHNEFNSLTNK